MASSNTGREHARYAGRPDERDQGRTSGARHELARWLLAASVLLLVGCSGAAGDDSFKSLTVLQRDLQRVVVEGHSESASAWYPGCGRYCRRD